MPRTEYAVLLGGIKRPDTRVGQLAKQTGVRQLVESGQMIALTRGRSRSTEGQQGLTVTPSRRGSRTHETTFATIGVAPDEITPLTEALTLETRLVCVAHSGRVDDETVPVAAVDLSERQPIVAPVRPVEAFATIRQEDLVDPV